VLPSPTARRTASFGSVTPRVNANAPAPVPPPSISASARSPISHTTSAAVACSPDSGPSSGTSSRVSIGTTP
jgi:hypothetical protein